MAKKKKAVINKKLCDHSPFCPAKRACVIGAITQQKSWFFKAEVPEIDQGKCVGCGRCVDFCPHRAIKMKTAHKETSQ